MHAAEAFPTGKAGWWDRPDASARIGSPRRSRRCSVDSSRYTALPSQLPRGQDRSTRREPSSAVLRSPSTARGMGKTKPSGRIIHKTVESWVVRPYSVRMSPPSSATVRSQPGIADKDSVNSSQGCVCHRGDSGTSSVTQRHLVDGHHEGKAVGPVCPHPLARVSGLTCMLSPVVAPGPTILFLS